MDGRKFVTITIGLMTTTLIILGTLLIKESKAAPTDDGVNKLLVSYVDAESDRQIVTQDVYVCDETYNIEPRELTGYKFNSKKSDSPSGKCLESGNTLITLRYSRTSVTPMTNASSSILDYALVSGIGILSIAIVITLIKQKKIS